MDALRWNNVSAARRSYDSGSARTSDGPLEAFFEVAARCNLHCQMCAINYDSRYLPGSKRPPFLTPDLFSVFVKVAHDYKLPFLAVRVSDERSKWLSLLSDKDIVLDSLVMFDPRVAPGRWTDSYVRALQSLKPGLHEIIVHLGHDDSELQAVTADHPDYGAAWRQRDFNAVTSSEFKKALEENHIILVGWKDLKKLL